MEVKKPTFEDKRKKRKLGLGIIFSYKGGYELNDYTYNFLIDSMFPRNDFINPHKYCFVKGNISEAISVFLSYKVRLHFPEFPEEGSGR